MKIKSGREEKYSNLQKKNNDFYGRGCLNYAARWAELLETKINASNATPEDVKDIIINNAKELSYEADTDGITGFMYTVAVNILSDCWEYGEYLRNWYNHEYEDEKER